MHASVREFVERVVATYDCTGPVLEVGSRDINGSVRDLFDDYLGVDIAEGPGVDTLATWDFYQRHPAHFAIVVCCEVLEHDPRPSRTLADIADVLRPGGLLILTARGFGPDQGSLEQTRIYGPHDYPADYWRFSVAGMSILFADAGLDVLEAGPDTDSSAPGVFMVGRKP